MWNTWNPLYFTNIFSKFHKLNQNLGLVNLADTYNKSQCQQFIEIYQHLEKQGALSEEAIFETALDMFKTKLEENKAKFAEQQQQDASNISLVADFKEAEGKPTPSVNLSDIFKA